MFISIYIYIYIHKYLKTNDDSSIISNYKEGFVLVHKKEGRHAIR